MECILCEDIGKERRYFFQKKFLCETHYVEYLEVLISEMGKNAVTSDSARSAFRIYMKRLHISLDDIPKEEEKEKPNEECNTKDNNQSSPDEESKNEQIFDSLSRNSARIEKLYKQIYGRR